MLFIKTAKKKKKKGPFYFVILIYLPSVGSGVIVPASELECVSLVSQLCVVSLALFRTLIGLHCEDVMLQLVLR